MKIILPDCLLLLTKKNSIIFLIFFGFLNQNSAQFQQNGLANHTSNECVELTPDINFGGFIGGSAFFPNEVDLFYPLDIEARLNFGDKDGDGGGGIAFVISTSPFYVTGGNGDMGYGGGSVFAVEMDTNPDIMPLIGKNDPLFDHMAIMNGSADHAVGTLAGPIMVPNLEDGEEHCFEFHWDPRTMTSTARLDDNEISFMGRIIPGARAYYWGFTAGTSDRSNSQNVCIKTANPSFIAMLDTEVCLGESVQLNADPAGAEFIWDPEPTLSSFDISDPSATPTVTTTYNVEIAFDCNFPSAFDDITVTVNQPPVAVAMGNGPLCTGETIQLMASGGSSGLDYQWEGPNNFRSNLQNPTTGPMNFPRRGIYTVTVTDSKGCEDVASVNIDYNLGTPALIDPIRDLCEGDGRYLASASPRGGFWSLDIAPNGEINTRDLGVGVFTGRYTYVSPNGCRDSTEITFEIFEEPIAEIIPFGPLCTSDERFDLGPFGVPSGGVWGGEALGVNFDPEATGPGLWEVTYEYTDSHGCSDKTTYEVEVFPTPAIGIVAPPTTVCLEADSILLIGSPVGGVWSDSINPNGYFDPSKYGVDTVLVTYTITDDGCASDSTIEIRIVDPTSVAFPSPIQFCAVDSVVILQANPSGGIWSGGVVDTFGQFNASTLVPGSYSTNYEVKDTFGCTYMGSFTFSVTDVPPIVFGNTGPFCEELTFTQITATPLGGTFGGVASPTGEIDPASLGVGRHNITYLVNDPNGCQNTATFEIEVVAEPTVTINPVGSICPELTSVQLTANPLGGTWGGSANASGQINPSALGAGSHNVTYTYTSLQNCTASDNINITISNPPSATISGNGSICAGSGNSVQMEVNFSGNDPWEFVFAINGVPQAPVTTSSNPYQFQATQTGTYTIVSVNDNLDCNSVGMGSGEVREIDALQIQNIETICNPTNTGYSVRFEITGGTPGTYMVTGLVGNVTLSAPYIFTSNDIPNGDLVNFQITDASGCLPINESVEFNCDCETEVGSMDTQPIVVCGSGTATSNYDNSGQNLDGNDVLQFILHTNSGISLGTILATNLSPTFSFSGGLTYGTTYYISAIVGDNDGSGGVDLNDFCKQLAPGTPVTWREIPEASLSGSNSVCEGDEAVFELQLTGESPWTVQYSDGTTTFDLIGITSSPFQFNVSPTQTGTFTLISVENAFCPGTVRGSVRIEIDDTPEIINVRTECDINKTFYTVTFDITGGDASSYNVTGAGTLTGNTFRSNPISAGMGYSFSVNDGNNCGQNQISEPTILCDCDSDAGTMAGGDLEVCVDEIAQASHNGDQVLDGNDNIIFVLHDGSAAALGNILAQNPSPDFSFLGSMAPGVPYFITAIAGNDNGSGGVDLSDACRSIAEGTQVVFNALPTAEFAGGATICEGDQAALTLNFTGEGPFNITIFDGSRNEVINGVNNGYQFLTTLNLTTDFEIILVEDVNCSNTSNSRATVNVNQPPTATLAGGADICNTSLNNDQTVLDFSTLITGGDRTGTWRDLDGSGTTGSFPNLDFDGTTPGQYRFEYTTAAAQAPCDNQRYEITINVRDCSCPSVSTAAPNPLCVTDAFLDLSTITITTEPGTWNLINAPIGSVVVISGGVFDATGAPSGNYEVEFSLNQQPLPGCPTSSTQTIVLLDSPFATLTSSADICNTDSNNDATVFDFSTLITAGDRNGVWTDLDGSGATGSFPNLDFNGAAEGQYRFRYTTQSAQAPCNEVSYEMTLNVRDCSCPSVSTSAAGPFCTTDAELDLSTITITGEPGSWSISNAPAGSTASILGNIFRATGSSEGDYELEFTLDQVPAPGCDLGSMQRITLFAPPSADLLSGGEICNTDSNNDETVFDFSTLITAGDRNGVWTDLDGSGATGSFPNLDFNGAAEGQYRFRYTTQSAQAPCDEVSYEMTLNVRDCSCPSVATAPAGPFCNDDAQLDLSSITITTEPGSWSISNAPAGSTASLLGNIFNATNSVAGDYVLEFTLSQAPFPGCDLGSSQTITISEFVTAGVGPGQLQICNDNSVFDLNDELSGETLGGTWVDNSSNPVTGFFNNGVLSLSGIPSGTYEFEYVVTTNPPCSNDSEIITIEIDNPVDAGEVSGSINVCEGVDTTISLFNLIRNNDAGGIWTDISNPPLPPFNFNDANARVNTANVPPGHYEFRYELLTRGICSSDAITVDIFINETPIADAGIDGSLTCDVRRVPLGGSNSGSGLNISYNWTGTGVVNPNSLFTEATDPGTYILNVKNDLTGCNSSDVIVVNQIGDLPILELEGIEIRCFGDSNGVILVSEISGGISPYVYSIDGAEFTTRDFFRNLAPGSYIVAVEDADGCGDEATITIDQPDELAIDLTVDLRNPDEPIILGDGVELNAYVRGSFDSLIWTPEGFIDCDLATDPFDCLTQFVEPTRTTTYGIEVFNGNGCSARSSLTINVAKESGNIFIPAAFSPNDDGYNDWLYVYGGRDVEQINKFIIFDRWGEVVHEYEDFKWDDSASGWNGYHKGRLMNDQVFVYLVEVLYKNGNTKIFEGDITLIKN